MRRVTLRRGQAGRYELRAALNDLGVPPGGDFCIVPASEFEGEIGKVGPHNNTQTSRAAAYANLPRRDSQRYAVLDALVKCRAYGATRDELAAMLSLSHQAVTPRVWELVKGGFAEETGQTRRTYLGQQGKVLLATPKARDQIEAS